MAAYYTFEDFSGGHTNGPKSDNPYQDVIDGCNNDATQIQARYNTHRTARNAQQKEKLLSPEFSGVTVDEILVKLEDSEKHPDFHDPRHCLVFWARPTKAVRELISHVQQKLRTVAPNLWIMPPMSLHLTALEITHSLTAPEIDLLVQRLLPRAPAITDFTLTHRARLVKPLLSFDAQALALSFLPAAGEPSRHSRSNGDDNNDTNDGDAYTYHHLRRDLFAQAQAAGVTVASRYVIPSAHLTIGRFITTEDFESAGAENGGKGEKTVDRGKVAELVRVIAEINEWLQAEYWPRDGKIRAGGEWIVGEEKGLDFRKGALWYGSGGETVRLGEGF